MSITIRGENAFDPTGGLDEIFASNCTVHLERMSKRAFCLIITTGDEEVIVKLGTRRARIGGFVFERSGTDTQKEQAR